MQVEKFKRKKVVIVGAGNVGATAALYLAQKNLADILLVDIVEGLPQGKALDIMESAICNNIKVKIEGSNDYGQMDGADMVVITAGLARKPGMSRLDLLKKNAEIVGGIVEDIKKYCPETHICMVTNPVDVMTYHTYKISGFEKNRVYGQAGVLDSARLTCFVAMELKVSPEEVNALVLGGHGDSMVPLPRFTTVNGIPITELMPAEKIEALMERTRKGGGEIVALLKTGSAYYAPAAATVKMVEAVLNDTSSVLPASVYLDGEYGIKDVFVGVPIVLGGKGVENIIELELAETELSQLQNSAAIYRQSLNELGY